ncbi:MAG: hypothetical protein AAF639_08115 [Chloroflexota bacterium]
MTRFKNWKTIAIIAIFSLIVALQPAITYASHGGCGGHTGC